MYQAEKLGYTTTDNSWCIPAIYYLENIDAAIAYVGRRSVGDVRNITYELNDAFTVGSKPLDWSALMSVEAPHKELSVVAEMYGKISIAQIVRSYGRRDWSIMINGEYHDIEQPVQAVAYLLATFW